MKVDISIGLNASTISLLREHFTWKDHVMATLAEIKEATRVNGEEARAAIDRVAVDVAALESKIADLIAMIEEMGDDSEELAELKAGLDEVATELGATSGLLAAFDPVPDEEPEPEPEPPVDEEPVP